MVLERVEKRLLPNKARVINRTFGALVPTFRSQRCVHQGAWSSARVRRWTLMLHFPYIVSVAGDFASQSTPPTESAYVILLPCCLRGASA